MVQGRRWDIMLFEKIIIKYRYPDRIVTYIKLVPSMAILKIL